MIQWAVVHSHCAACFGKKKKQHCRLQHLRSVPPGSVSDWQVQHRVHCLAALEPFIELLASALLFDWFLWKQTNTTVQPGGITTQHYTYTCLNRAVSVFVLDASQPVGLLGAGDGRHGSHPGPRLLQVAAGAERLRLDRDLLLPLVLEGLGLGWGRTIKELKYLWNDNTG